MKLQEDKGLTHLQSYINLKERWQQLMQKKKMIDESVTL